ncbi:MAG: Coenzyme F420 hydrogenase/dehydrogenase, beta subunit C-terminal domain [Proteobacteria bacterium]|nr:Coenzyme F420 hydrogenase/dehydrogenase, beta subunit C-terminal domain [Pseudomonadota bacterium]
MRRSRKDAPTYHDIPAGKYDAEFLLGEYKRLLLARSGDALVREAAASGGVITEVLCAGLARGEFDAVLSVGFAGDDPVTPCYLVSRTPEELRARSGSVYSYVSPTQLKEAVAGLGGRRLAVVCQPCLVPLVRRWQERGEHDVRAVVSFFCGYNMTHEATHYLLGKAGVRPEDVAWIRYRHGDYPGGFAVKPRNGEPVGFGKESYELVNLQFVRRGCSHCSLYMGEDADLSCGDAWIQEHPNLTAVLARTEAGLSLLEASQERLEFYALKERDLLAMHLHNLVYKKYGNSWFLRLLTVVFRDLLPKPLAPFRLLSALSRHRRSRKIGVSVPDLKPVEKLRG